MLVEITIRNYAVIDRLTVALGAGFNVLTGETGAGKSIILDALGLLLGDRVDPGAVRAGERQAYVEGIFEVAPEVATMLSEMLDLDVSTDGLIVAREVNVSGRSVCRINGRAFPQRRLSEAGMLLVDVHGQSEHLSLLRPPQHIDLLDRYAGLMDQRNRYSQVVRSLSRSVKARQALEQEYEESVRRRDLLAFQAEEISAAGLRPGEEESLTSERTQRVNALRIQELVALAQGALAGEDTVGSSAIEFIGRAGQALAALEKIDEAIAATRAAVESTALQLEELVRDLRDYAEGVEFDQVRLTEIEERLEMIASLKRKYGSTVAEVIEFEARANQDLNRLQTHGDSVAHLIAEEEGLRVEAAGLAGQLAEGRRSAAHSLAAGVEEQLAGLGMDGARFAVSFEVVPRADGLSVALPGEVRCCVVASTGQEAEPAGTDPAEGPFGFGSTGVDRVEFLITANPGEPLRPLATVASGGETSRLMLAIKGVLSQADVVPTLIFDEIDAGIGGRVGEAVGRRLWGLGRDHQVVAVTHLPQIAAYADHHLSVRKVVEEGRTATRVVAVEGDQRVNEVAAMLGSDSQATRQKAEELIRETGKAVAKAGREG